MTTRRQHYVWKHYLSSWLNERGKLYCLRQGKIFHTTPSNIMVQRDFYKVPHISANDVLFLESWLIPKTSQATQPLHRNLLRRFKNIADLYEVAHQDKGASTVDKALVNSLVIETLEKLHQSIEGSAVPILDELRSKRLDFLQTKYTAVSFFHFVAHQYMRTKRIHEDIKTVLRDSQMGLNLGHLTNFMCYFAATNMSYSFYEERRDWRFIFLDNFTENRFITGDQPIVNLLGDGPLEHDDIVLYYPLTSRLALLMVSKKYTLVSTKVTDVRVEYFNSWIAWKSQESIVSKSAVELEIARNQWPSASPGWQEFLDVLR